MQKRRTTKPLPPNSQNTKNVARRKSKIFKYPTNIRIAINLIDSH